MIKRHENAELLITLLLSMFTAGGLLYAARLPYNTDGKIFGVNYNLAVYILLLAGAFIVFLLLRAVLHLIPAGSGEVRPFAGFILMLIYAASALFLTLFIFYIYKNENNIYPENNSADYIRQLVPHRWYFLVIIIISALLFFTADRKEAAGNLRRRAAIGTVFCILNAFIDYSASPFMDNGGGAYHVHAVTNTIVNVARGIPFSDYNNSIYGHYALIFYPFVKLFGNNYEAIAISISFFAFLTFAAAFYAASRLIKRDDVFFLTVSAITATSAVLARRGQYYQINPLRLITPAFTLALIAFALRGSSQKSGLSEKNSGEVPLSRQDARRNGHDSKLPLRGSLENYVLELILGIAAVIWNLETGIFAVLTISAMHIFISLRENRFFSLATLKMILFRIIYCVLCGGAAFALVGLYNVAAGGAFGTVRQFIYPIMSGTYTVSHLRIPLPSAPCFYLFEIIVFFAAILTAILKRPSANADGMGKLALLFSAGLSGLLSLIYFINRPAYGNLAISTMQMGILLGFFSEKAFSFSKKDIRVFLKMPQKFGRAVLSGVLFISLVFSAAEGLLYSGISIQNRVLPGSWTRGGFESAEAWISETVSEDAIACGCMLPEIYFDMGRDPHISLTDWSDMNDMNLTYAEKEIEKYDSVLIESGSKLEPYMANNKNYRQISSFTCGSETYIYYEAVK